MRYGRFWLILAVLGGVAAKAEVIDPGAGKTVDRGTVTGADSVEVKSGIVSLDLDPQYSGDFKVSGGTVVMGDISSPTSLSTKVVWTGDANEAPVPFKIRRNNEFDWIKVTPEEGVIGGPGGVTEFNIDFDASVMTNRHFYRGAFLVRATNGLSRVVSILSETDFVPEFHAEQPGDFVQFCFATNPASGSAVAGEATYAFTVPVATNYYFMIHGAGTATQQKKIQAAVDDDEYQQSVQQVQSYPTWTMISPSKGFGDYMRAYFLQPGVHTLRIKYDSYSSYPYDAVLITDKPESFEPR